jgi:hypothetical protein
MSAWGRKSRNRSGFEVVMPGRLSDGARSSESRGTALRRGAAFGNMRKLTMRLGGVGHKPPQNESWLPLSGHWG